MSALPYISVVVPVYNEQENLEPLTRELAEVLAEIDRPYEIIFVDDGSTDASPQKIEELRQQYAGHSGDPLQKELRPDLGL